MRKSVLTVGVLGFFLLAAGAYAVSNVLQAKPDEFDPSKTRLVQTTWLEGIGCPTEATIAPFGEDETTYTDPACPTGEGPHADRARLRHPQAGSLGRPARLALRCRRTSLQRRDRSGRLLHRV